MGDIDRPRESGYIHTTYTKTKDLTHNKHDPSERVWGAAYHIPTAHAASVREYLDIREINGYSIQFTPFHPAASTIATATSEPSGKDDEDERGDGGGKGITRTRSASVSFSDSKAIRCLVYIGLPENPQFLGPQDPEELAGHILESTFSLSVPRSLVVVLGFVLICAVGIGPSGENKEYLYNLASALLGLSKESEDAHVSDLVRRCREIEGEADEDVEEEVDHEAEGYVRLEGEDGSDEDDEDDGTIEEIEKKL